MIDANLTQQNLRKTVVFADKSEGMIVAYNNALRVARVKKGNEKSKQVSYKEITLKA